MKSLFESEQLNEVKERVARLKPDSVRLWGKMDVAQALAHCSLSVESALGDTNPPRMFIGRIIGRFIKPMALGKGDMQKNAPTVPDFVVANARNLEVERERLFALLTRLYAAGPAGCTTYPHSFFGRMTGNEWGVLMYKHLDHHLRQFGA